MISSRKQASALINGVAFALPLFLGRAITKPVNATVDNYLASNRNVASAIMPHLFQYLSSHVANGDGEGGGVRYDVKVEVLKIVMCTGEYGRKEIIDCQYFDLYAEFKRTRQGVELKKETYLD